MISSPTSQATTAEPAPAAPTAPAAPARQGAERQAEPGRAPAPTRADLWTAAALSAGALALYVTTLLPGVGYSGDVAKWQFLGRAGGTPHATGYPLFLMLDKAWVTVFPFGSLAWRVNLLSAVFGAAAVGMLALLLRTLGARLAVAAATAATFAVTLTFWSQAVVAEVYTLHVLLLTAVTLCLARWRFGGSVWWLRAGIALLALSFGNHLGTVLAIPGVVWLVLSDWRRAVTVRNVAWAVGAAAVAVAQYGYLLWMNDVGRYAEYRIETWGDVWEMVTGSPFRDAMFTFGPRELVDMRLPMLARLGWREVSLLALPAAYGAWQAVRGGGPRRHVAVQLLLLGLGAAVYALEFGVEDVFVFFLPLWLVIAVFLGLGAEEVAARLGPQLRDRRWRTAATAVLVAVPATLAVVNVSRADASGDTAHARRIERLIDAAGSDALLVTDNYRDSEFIWYYLLGEDLGDRRNLRLGNQLVPPRVRRYVEGGPLPGIAPAGLPVYTATPSQARALRDAGLEVIEVAPSVWRVEAGG